jgi:hypothetical protein
MSKSEAWTPNEFTVHHTDKGEEKVESQQLEMPETSSERPNASSGKKHRARGAADRSLNGGDYSEATCCEVADILKWQALVLDRRIPANRSRLRHKGGNWRGSGVIAPLVGKKPSDAHIWVYEARRQLFLDSRVL